MHKFDRDLTVSVSRHVKNNSSLQEKKKLFSINFYVIGYRSTSVLSFGFGFFFFLDEGHIKGQKKNPCYQHLSMVVIPAHTSLA